MWQNTSSAPHRVALVALTTLVAWVWYVHAGVVRGVSRVRHHLHGRILPLHQHDPGAARRLLLVQQLLRLPPGAAPGHLRRRVHQHLGRQRDLSACRPIPTQVTGNASSKAGCTTAGGVSVCVLCHVQRHV